VRVLLVSTYDLGRQPFGLASPAAWLRNAGHEVATADLSRELFPVEIARVADWVAFHLPMHTATRLALPQILKVKRLNPGAQICCYGLYAPVNKGMLLGLGVTQVIGGEFEQALVDAISGKSTSSSVVLDRLAFQVPDRRTLPVLQDYAGLTANGTRKAVGYTEASRGCKHLCRHCPVVPVYEGKFRVVQREVVLADVRQQVAAGAEHITFGDPDFFNGPTHALAIINAFHEEFPAITYDVTIKIEHLLKHREAMAELKRTGCLFITSAVESLDDAVLSRLSKGHTRADFLEALAISRSLGLTLTPTFIPFTPWTKREDYLDLLSTIRDLGLVENVAPIQLAIRLLVPAGSRLLEVDDLPLSEFDPEALSFRWAHPDPEMDILCADLQKIAATGLPRAEVFGLMWERAFGTKADFDTGLTEPIPQMTEPWYCCAEPEPRLL
jgi:radical SAM superfamily enzyme YgiQ (UPF0313 family)